MRVARQIARVINYVINYVTVQSDTDVRSLTIVYNRPPAQLREGIYRGHSTANTYEQAARIEPRTLGLTQRTDSYNGSRCVIILLTYLLLFFFYHSSRSFYVIKIN